jgi:hypothetical protein
VVLLYVELNDEFSITNIVKMETRLKGK